MKIDAFCHIMPRPYYDRFFTLEETVHAANLRKRVANIPCLVDMDVRFAQMDEFGDYRQLINICAPPVEDLGSPEISRQMARIGNEALAEVLATSDVPPGVVNILTGRTAELAPVLAAHMDVNAIDLTGADVADRTGLARMAAGNVKRVLVSDDDWAAPPGPERMLAFLEIKTVWHPIGI